MSFRLKCASRRRELRSDYHNNSNIGPVNVNTNFCAFHVGTNIMHMRFLFRVVLFMFLGTTLLSASDNPVPKRQYKTQSIVGQSAPEIDGNVDDDIWSKVEWTSDFVQWKPNENSAPTYQTKFKVLYDEKHLYFAFQCIDDEPHKIADILSRRDGFDGDWVEVNIDSYHDLRTGFSFTVSSSGVKGDEFISENGKEWDPSWNPIWVAKAAKNENGWSAEMKIPLSQLRFGSHDDQTWGLQVQRRLFREDERSVWQRMPLDAPGWVSEMGQLTGLQKMTPQKQIEIQPYISSQVTTRDAVEGNPFSKSRSAALNAGLDAKIGVTNDLTLDLTINPDFGQVEADPAAIALDGFQIFFEERRPFFVENKNIFSFDLSRNRRGRNTLFYSRRIGRSPQGYPNLNDGEYTKIPLNSKILGAAKFSGKTKNGWSIGVLESVTSREFAKISDGTNERKEEVEPMTSYAVGRLQKDFNNRNSFIGFILTSTNRFNLNENLSHLHSDAFTGGIDFKHQWHNRVYSITGRILGSNVLGSKESIANTQLSLARLYQREDAGHLEYDPNRTSLRGSGATVNFRRQKGHWDLSFGGSYRSPGLELNDIGFLRDTDEIRQEAQVVWQTLKATDYFRSMRFRLSQFTTYDFDGNWNRIQVEGTSRLVFTNNWSFNLGFGHKPRIYINSFLRGGPRWRFSDENFVFAFFNSDERLKFQTTIGSIFSRAKQNHFEFLRFETRFLYRPTNSLNISVEPNFAQQKNQTQYVTQLSHQDKTRYILSGFKNQTFAIPIRINYILNPNLSIQYYGEPFVTKALYQDFKYVNNPVAEDLYDRFTSYENNQIAYVDGAYVVDENVDGLADYRIGNPDFTYVQFKSNLVMRWEYIPGSELFLVWSQGSTGTVSTSLNLLSGLDQQILGTRPENIFLMKLTYRFRS